VCCVWLGERRSTTNAYTQDSLAYVKAQVRSLQELEHNLKTIVFVFNLQEEHKLLFEEAKNLIPSTIRNANVDIIQRKNIGMSYGAWSDSFGKHRKNHDYFIFTEDDYFFTEHFFDNYLVSKFQSKIKIGYLCFLASNPAPGFPTDKVHAGNSIGISSTKVLNEVWDRFGFLPYHRSEIEDLQERYELTEDEGQISQTYEIYRLGYNILDIREDYVVPHDTGPTRKDIAHEFDNVVEMYFCWNKKYLAVPAVMHFKESYFYVEVIDDQYQSKNTCYVINFYFGKRRKSIEEYNEDRLCFLKKQIETLTTYYHNINKIVFSINFDSSHLKEVNEALKIIPKKIQNSDVEVFLRENKGLSYGAFSDNFNRLRNDYDYFIFNEDDYFLVENNWDEYLVTKYNALPQSGYLCAIMRDEDYWNDNKIHAGHCFGIASTKSLNKVWEKYGCLPHSNDTNDYATQEKVQHDFGYSFIAVGLRVYDIREEYRVAFARTDDNAEDIWRWFWWNEKDLIVPAVMAFDKPYSWWESWDGPCIRKTNIEKYEN